MTSRSKRPTAAERRAAAGDQATNAITDPPIDGAPAAGAAPSEPPADAPEAPSDDAPASEEPTAPEAPSDDGDDGDEGDEGEPDENGEETCVHPSCADPLIPVQTSYHMSRLGPMHVECSHKSIPIR